MSVSSISHRIGVQNILFTTDFSAVSEVALPYARAFCRWYGSKLFIAHAIPYEPLLRLSMEQLPMEADPYWLGAQRQMAALNRAHNSARVPDEARRAIARAVRFH